jgi:hypothetical protein
LWFVGDAGILLLSPLAGCHHVSGGMKVVVSYWEKSGAECMLGVQD